MRLFISWSGDLSHQIAECLFDWLPMVLQGVEPYMSSESIEKGARWSTHLGKELEEARFGVVVLTRENLQSPWLHFEAGAVAKSVDEARLAPLLFSLRPGDILQLLSQFQVTVFDQDDMRKLLKSANLAGEMALMPEHRLLVLFEKLWPDLRQKIDSILATYKTDTLSSSRGMDEILEEILVLSREQAMALAHPDRLLGTSVEALIARVLGAYFESEATLSAQERSAVLALIGRWNALNKRLLSHFEQEGLPLKADGVHRQLQQFQRYLEEATTLLTSASQRRAG